MQTRRLSKRLNANASVADSEGDVSVAAPPSEAGSIIHSLEVEIPQDLDVDALQALLPSLVATKPSPDAILSLYKAFLEQTVFITELTREKDAARAEVSRYEVELDQALQDQDVQTGQLRTALEETQAELVQVKKQKDELRKPDFSRVAHFECAHNLLCVDSTRNSLQQQISSLTTSFSTSSHETDDLRRQITQIQGEKRDLLGVVDSLREEITQREGEAYTAFVCQLWPLS
jgi:nucleoprotein TPR